MNNDEPPGKRVYTVRGILRGRWHDVTVEAGSIAEARKLALREFTSAGDIVGVWQRRDREAAG